MTARLRIIGAGIATLLLVAAVPLVAREFGPTATVRVPDGERFLDVKVWYVSRDGASWIRCGDASREWCVKLAQAPVASLGSSGLYRGVFVEAVPGPEAVERFQGWLEEDHRLLGRLPRLRSMANALVFRLSTLGRHTPAKPGGGWASDSPGSASAGGDAPHEH